MRKEIMKTAIISLMLVFPTMVVPIMAGGNNNPNKIHGSPAYVLNILGKKVDWKGNGYYNNTDRHTMFIPEETPGYNITMHISEGQEFGVLDGNAFDDNETSLQLKKGRYYIYIVALAKPGGDAKIWAKAGLTLDSEGNLLIPLMQDYLNVKRSKGQPFWENATGMFYVSWDDVVSIVFAGVIPTFEQLQALADALGVVQGEDVWIFDFLNYMTDLPEYLESFYCARARAEYRLYVPILKWVEVHDQSHYLIFILGFDYPESLAQPYHVRAHYMVKMRNQFREALKDDDLQKAFDELWP